MVDLGTAALDPVLDAVLAAAHGEHVCDEAGGGPVGVARREAELDAVVGEHRVDAVRHGLDQGDEEGRRGDAGGALDQLDKGELAGAIDGDEQVELAFRGLRLGDVDVEEADRVALEGLLGRLVAVDGRRSAVG